MRALVFCTVGGAAGVVAGFYLVDPYLSPPQKKMIFVSIYFSFAFALFLLNRYRNRKTFTAIPSVKVWKVGTVFIAETILDSECIDLCCHATTGVCVAERLPWRNAVGFHNYLYAYSHTSVYGTLYYFMIS